MSETDTTEVTRVGSRRALPRRRRTKVIRGMSVVVVAVASGLSFMVFDWDAVRGGDRRESGDKLCGMLTADKVKTAVGRAPADVRATKNRCDYVFDGYTFRLSDRTGTIKGLDKRANVELMRGLGDHLSKSGEKGYTSIGGVGNGAFRLADGSIFVVKGDRIYLLDRAPGKLPDRVDGKAVLVKLTTAAFGNGDFAS